MSNIQPHTEKIRITVDSRAWISALKMNGPITSPMLADSKTVTSLVLSGARVIKHYGAGQTLVLTPSNLASAFDNVPKRFSHFTPASHSESIRPATAVKAATKPAPVKPTQKTINSGVDATVGENPGVINHTEAKAEEKVEEPKKQPAPEAKPEPKEAEVAPMSEEAPEAAPAKLEPLMASDYELTFKEDGTVDTDVIPWERFGSNQTKKLNGIIAAHNATV